MGRYDGEDYDDSYYQRREIVRLKDWVSALTAERDRLQRALDAIEAVRLDRSEDVQAFLGQYRGARAGSVARFCCDLIDAIDAATENGSRPLSDEETQP